MAKLKKLHIFFNLFFNHYYYLIKKQHLNDIIYKSSIDYLNKKITEDIYFDVLKKELKNQNCLSKRYARLLDIKYDLHLIYYSHSLLDIIVLAIKSQNNYGARLKKENLNFLLEKINHKNVGEIFSEQYIGIQGSGIKNYSLLRLQSYVVAFYSGSPQYESYHLSDFYQMINKILSVYGNNKIDKLIYIAEVLINLLNEYNHEQNKAILYKFLENIDDENFPNKINIEWLENKIEKQVKLSFANFMFELKSLIEKKEIGREISSGNGNKIKKL